MYKVYFTNYNYNNENATFVRLFSNKNEAINFCKQRAFRNTNGENKTYYMTATGCYYIMKGSKIL